MDGVNKLVVNAIKKIWYKDVKDEAKWKGSWPDWEWRETLNQSISDWLDARRQNEGAENLWRIHDKLYDLQDWVNKHPGGSFWISTTKGTDITEAFESHHLTKQAESILPKYYIRDATKPRNSPFTFHEDGFFRSLKKEIMAYLEKNDVTKPKFRSQLYTDSLLAISLALSVIAGMYNNYLAAMLSGVFMCFVVICGHNYFHRKDNFRMYYFNFSLMSYREWRIQHALSHHCYPNTRYDLEVMMFTPFLQWLTRDDKTLFSRYASWIYSPIAYCVIFHKQFFFRVFSNPDGLAELVPFLYPATMICIGGASVVQALILWQVLIVTGSFVFGLVGVSTGHHHPDLFHDGDYARDDKDWGLYQLDAVRERIDIKGSMPLVMITFGDHALHHLFPTIDHAILDELYPILTDVCKKFGFPFLYTNALELVKGQFQQLARTTPKANYQILNPPKEIRNKNNSDNTEK